MGRRSFRRIDMGGILESGTRRQAENFDDAGIAHAILHAKGVAHRTGDDLKFGLILGGKSDQHHEKADQQSHQIGEGDEPPVTAAVTCFLASRHDIAPNRAAYAATASASSSSSSSSVWRCFSGR